MTMGYDALFEAIEREGKDGWRFCQAFEASRRRPGAVNPLSQFSHENLWLVIFQREAPKPDTSAEREAAQEEVRRVFRGE